MPPDVSVVIVNWNTAHLLQTCLQSLLTASLPPHGLEVIVVDNASTDGSPQLVIEHFPEVKLLTNPLNLGYARANNQGLNVAIGRYALLLNSDTIVPPDLPAGLVAFMDSHPQVGACSPRLLRPDKTPQPYAFGGDPTVLYILTRGLNSLLLKRYLHNWAVTVPLQVDWVSGACLMVRSQVFNQIGGLDENIFMYFEDNDWCLRMRRQGWKIYYYPQLSITHLGGQSLIQNPEACRVYYRSLSYFYTKHYGPFARFLLYVGLIPYRLLVRY